jgi:hypothetical protein
MISNSSVQHRSRAEATAKACFSAIRPRSVRSIRVMSTRPDNTRSFGIMPVGALTRSRKGGDIAVTFTASDGRALAQMPPNWRQAQEALR